MRTSRKSIGNHFMEQLMFLQHFNIFNCCLRSVFDYHALLIQKRARGQSFPWLSRDIKKLMSDRDKLLRKAGRTKSQADWNSYKQMSNFGTNQVRRAKANYHQDLLNENCDNPRKFWAAIKSIFPTKICKSQVQSVDQGKTKKFSDYFKNAIPLLKQKSIH